jgi:hypothetical protein
MNIYWETTAGETDDVADLWDSDNWTDTPSDGDTIIVGAGAQNITGADAPAPKPASFVVGRAFDGNIGEDELQVIGYGTGPRWVFQPGGAVRIEMDDTATARTGDLIVVSARGSSIELTDSRTCDDWDNGSQRNTAAIVCHSGGSVNVTQSVGAQAFTVIRISGDTGAVVDITGCEADTIISDGCTVYGGTATTWHVFSGRVEPENVQVLKQYGGQTHLGRRGAVVLATFHLYGGECFADQATFPITWPTGPLNVYASGGELHVPQTFALAQTGTAEATIPGGSAVTIGTV